MTTAQLRERAERVLFACEQMSELLGVLGTDLDGPIEVAADLARRFIADHPADDDEIVTAEWLRTVGGTPDPSDLTTVLFRLGDRLPVWVGVDASGFSGCVQNGPDYTNTETFQDLGAARFPTRGHVRRLCAALGISLSKEP